MTTHDRALADLHSLAETDRALAERADALRRRDAEAAELRLRAEGVLAFLAAYPAEHDARAAALRDAEDEVARRRAELADAEQAVESSDDPEHARKAVNRARDHVAVAESTLLRARAAHDEHERLAASLPEDLAELERRAGTHDIVEWAAQQHADLFVELGQLATQRERVIREANEIASMLLGEQTHGSTAAQALAKVVGPLARE